MSPYLPIGSNGICEAKQSELDAEDEELESAMNEKKIRKT